MGINRFVKLDKHTKLTTSTSAEYFVKSLKPTVIGQNRENWPKIGQSLKNWPKPTRIDLNLS